MIRKLEREYITSQIAALDHLIERTTAEDVLGRDSLESQREDFVAQLAKTEMRVDGSAEAALLFEGDPVVGSMGIEAKFAAEALERYQDIVALRAATRRAGATLKTRGRVPAERESRLHVTNVVHGSFGFELREITSQVSLARTLLADAVEDVGRIVAAAQDSDEKFAEVAAGLDPRLWDGIKKFFEAAQKAGAMPRLVTLDTDVRFDRGAVAAAVERASAAVREMREDVIVGVFRGALLESRRFELVSGEGESLRKVSGTISLDMGNEEFDALGQWNNRRCAARLRVVTIKRAEKTTERFSLLSVEAARD